jgi:hypothetical protein
MSLDGWVNHNPNPLVHLWGRSGSRQVALCGVIVRERVGEFDRADPRACPGCIEALDAGYTYEQFSAIRGERTKARMASGEFRGFVCRDVDING